MHKRACNCLTKNLLCFIVRNLFGGIEWCTWSSYSNVAMAIRFRHPHNDPVGVRTSCSVLHLEIIPKHLKTGSPIKLKRNGLSHFIWHSLRCQTHMDFLPQQVFGDNHALDSHEFIHPDHLHLRNHLWSNWLGVDRLLVCILTQLLAGSWPSRSKESPCVLPCILLAMAECCCTHACHEPASKVGGPAPSEKARTCGWAMLRWKGWRARKTRDIASGEGDGEMDSGGQSWAKLQVCDWWREVPRMTAIICQLGLAWNSPTGNGVNRSN